MSEILQDKSPARISLAIEENLSSWVPVLGKMGEVHIDDPAGVKRSITDYPIPLFNSVMDTRLEPEQVEAAVQSILSDAGRRNVPVLWWTGPSTSPTELGILLAKYGFIPDDDAPGMAVDLALLNEDLPAVEGLSIQQACEAVSRRQWCTTMALGFEVPAAAVFLVDAWDRLLIMADPESIRIYLGWLDDKPVATSLLFLAAGVAGIYSVATIPEARRKGIGAWMTLQPLLEARAMGYQLGILQSSQMGVKVYQSLGFKEYCKIYSYRWEKGSNPV